MECVNKNCNVSGSERMVSCWLCLGSCHLKCCGLKARDADALADRCKNLQWTCPNCRIVGIEFYNFFKSYKTEFEDIKNNFMALKSKLDKYGELFSNFKNLDDFASSPKSKKRKSSKQLSKQASSSPSGMPNNAKEVATTVGDIDIAPSSNLLALQANSSTLPPQIHSNPIPNLSSIPHPSLNERTQELMLFSPLPPNDTAQNANSGNVQLVNQCMPVEEPKPLRVMPRLKSIFASRFAIDTSVLDLEFYLKNKMGQDLYNGIKIFKINARSRASFKIIVPEDLYDCIVDPKMWPKGALIREFMYREDGNIRLPNVADNNQKN